MLVFILFFWVGGWVGGVFLWVVGGGCVGGWGREFVSFFFQYYFSLLVVSRDHSSQGRKRSLKQNRFLVRRRMLFLRVFTFFGKCNRVEHHSEAVGQ